MIDRVKRGAELLDKEFPLWWEKVNVRELAMNSCCDCILGQLYGEYVWGRAELFHGDVSMKSVKAQAYGFMLPREEAPNLQHSLFKELSALWVREIANRRER